MIFATIAAPAAWAQGGSNYSALGIGDLRPTIGGMYDAMGGTTIAMPTPYGINVVNPALVGMATTTRIQLGYQFNQHVISNTDGRSQAQNNGEIDGLLALFSVDTSYGFGFSFGLVPYSTVAYDVQRNLSTDLDGSAITGVSQQTGTGGASLLHFSSSVRLFDRIYLGLGLGGMFGVIQYSDEVRLDGPFNVVASSQSYDVRGFLYRIGTYIKVTDWLNVGAFASGGLDATVFVTRRAAGFSGAGTGFDTTQITRTETGMPKQVGFGISTPIGEGFIGADLALGDFTDVTINVRDDAGYGTGIRTSLGLTQPGSSSRSASWDKKIGYHAGLSFNKLYVTYKNQNINEYFVSGGVSFPLGGTAMVDTGIQLGSRSPLADDSISEFVGRLTVTVSIGETWFKPFSRD